MNYKIIADKEHLFEFIEWLPQLGPNECYYLCLFARSKYAKNTDGTNKFPHIKSDKNQLKRFVCSKKEYIYNKIQQLEVEIGAYKTKDGDPVPQESLALYINPSPRNQKNAMYVLMRRLIDIQESNGENFNIHAEALSAIQKSGNKKLFFDFDIDGAEATWSALNELCHTDKINKGCLTLVKTRGGLHVLVELSKIAAEYKNTWYKWMTETLDIDIKGDNMIPVPGTFQGGFTPHFIEI